MKRTAHQTLVANLKRVMRARHIPNQNQLAKACKINQKTMNNLMDVSRDITPSLGTVQRIADELHIPVWALFLPDLPVVQMNMNGFPDTTSAAGIYLMGTFDTLDQATQRELLGYTAYVLDRAGDIHHRDKIQEIRSGDYNLKLLESPKNEEEEDDG